MKRVWNEIWQGTNKRAVTAAVILAILTVCGVAYVYA